MSSTQLEQFKKSLNDLYNHVSSLEEENATLKVALDKTVKELKENSKKTEPSTDLNDAIVKKITTFNKCLIDIKNVVNNDDISNSDLRNVIDDLIIKAFSG